MLHLFRIFKKSRKQFINQNDLIMRKFTLLFALVAFTSFVFAQTASKDECELTKNDVVEMAVKKTAELTKDAGDVYWEEDFDVERWEGTTPDNMPANWTVFDGNGENFYWVWTMEGPKGAYTSPNSGDIKEDQEPWNTGIERIDELGGTASNGFVLLNGDWYNTAEDGNIVSGVLSMDSYIQVTGIDLSSSIGATLKFNQMYRWCCSGSNQLSVFVASDYDEANPENAHWVELDARGLLAQVNEHTFIQDRQMQFDISAIAKEQPNLTIRIHKIGASHYYWMVDDLQIVEPNNYDLVADRAWWHYALEPFTGEGADPDEDWNGGYTKIPAEQLQDFVGFNVAVTNFGLAAVDNAQLQVTIMKDGAEVFNQTGLSKAIAPTVKDTLALNTTFTPPGIGEYQVSSTVIFEEVDEDPANNSFTYDFAVTEGTYSRVYDEPYAGRVMTGAWVSGGNPGDALMTKFEIFEDAELLSVTTFFWDNSDEEQIADIEAGNYSMIGRLYKVDEENDEIPNTPIISTELRQMVVADTMTYITMDVLSDGESEFLTAGQYYLGIETYTSSVDIDFEIGEDLRVQQPFDNSYAWFSGELGGIDSNPVIIMNIDPSDGRYAVTWNLTIEDESIVVGADDVVKVVGTFTEASGEVVLEEDGGVYTGTERIFPGEYTFDFYLNDVKITDEAFDLDVVDMPVEFNHTIVTVDELDLSNISIYPNPVNDELTIQNMNNVDRIVISNIIGQEVMNITGFERNVNINTSNLENGVYVVTFIDANNNMESTRIIKK